MKGITIFWYWSICFIILGIITYCTINTTNAVDERFENLESRIEVLEMEATTNKLLLKQTQRLLVPDEVALLRRIPARQ